MCLGGFLWPLFAAGPSDDDNAGGVDYHASLAPSFYLSTTLCLTAFLYFPSLQMLPA